MNKLILIAFLFVCGIANSQRIRTVNFGQKVYTPGGGGGGGGGTTTDGHFDFQIYSAVKTSAGVFRFDSTLVRTLWADRQYVFPGTYTAYWDGKDDYGNTLSPQDANYQVRVLANNLQYTWQGVIGNSSSSLTGNTIHKGGYHTMQGLCFIGSTGYYCTGYGEGASPLSKFNTATPQQRIRFAIQGDVNYVATDGTLVYWGYQDGNSPDNNMVIATKPADDLEYLFTNGQPYGSHVQAGISVMSAPNTLITGLAVQPTGNHLFVARAGQNNLYVLNKTTGAAVRTLGFTNIHGLACDNSNNLWILYATNTIQKYSVDGSGNLSSMGTIPGTTSPLSIWYGNGLLAVCEGGNSQVVKFFNNTTFAATTTLGTSGGYFTNSDVTDTKFYFTDVNGQGTGQYFKTSFVAWQTDNSYWVQDAGNYRIQHFSSSNSFIDRIQSLGACYSVYIDRGNINRLFIEHMEFEMDYSVQMLTGTTGWILKRNWGSNIPVPTYDGQPRFQVTLSNGRTYGFIRKGYDLEVVEFVTGSQLRFTGNIIFQNLTAVLCANGDLQLTTDASGVYTVKRYALTSFDGSNNPVWSGTGVTLGVQPFDATLGSPAAIPFFEVMDPARQKVYWYQPTNRINNGMTRLGPPEGFTRTFNWIWQSETNNRLVRIDPHTITVHTKMHIGQTPVGAVGTWTWQTDRSTQQNYRGDYPPVPYFDCGNLVQGNAGSNAAVLGRNIIVGYKGEFWKNSQTNEYNHYYEDGLALGQFGVAYNEVAGQEAPAEMAGNANTPILVRDATGELYFYHGDEGHHAGAHRWKISGVSSIFEQKITIANPITYIDPTKPYIDLMAGVPFDQTLPNGAGGWNRSPTTDNAEWTVWTSTYTPPNGYGYNDISGKTIMSTNGVNSFEKVTGVTTNVANSWQLKGNLSWGESNTGAVPDRECWFDVLDENGLVISRLTQNGAYQQPTVLKGNASTIKSADAGLMLNELSRDIPFTIDASGGNITFTIGSYTAVTAAPLNGSANWRRPAKVKVSFVKAGGGSQSLEFYVKNLWLYRG